MEKEEFENTLRSYIRSEPFQPFVVEMNDGELIHVGTPSVAFNNGYAGYLSDDYEMRQFACEDVREIRLASKEPA